VSRHREELGSAFVFGFRLYLKQILRGPDSGQPLFFVFDGQAGESSTPFASSEQTTGY